MQSINQPAKFLVPFAQNDSAKVEIPATTPDATRFSQSLGSPPLTGMPPEAGGVPPQLEDFNGAINQQSRVAWWYMGGNRFPFDATWAGDALIGGYARGAVLPAAIGAGLIGMGEWLNNAEDNVANPDTDGTGWVPGYHYGATALTGQTGGTVTLSPAQAGKRVIAVAGTLTSNLVLVVPGWIYDWNVYNTTGGAFTVTVKNAATSGVVIPQNGAPTPVHCDGTACTLVAANIAPAISPTQAARLDQVDPGRLLNVQRFAASGTYTPTAGTRLVRVTVVGGGGGGGACSNTAAGQTSVGSSGGGGGYAIGLLAVPSAGAAVTVGAAGAAGSGGTPVGQPGGSSGFAGLTASGGSGGAVGSAVAPPNATGGSGGGLGTGGNISNGSGTSGAPGIHVSTGAVIAGMSGATLFGGAVSNAAVGGAGADGQGGGAPGAGGSGGVATQAQPGRQGGNGAAGIVIIEEYA